MTARPIVIAHRGASGYLPEHTLESKALAYGLGADYLEQDVVATRDHELVVLHDIYLDDVTDVALRFADRRRPDGRFYAIDFDWSELRELRVHERRRPGTSELLFPRRFSNDAAEFRIARLVDELALVQGLNRSTGRNVGIYPEIKDPKWHADHGVDLASLLIDALTQFGYRESTDAAFVQCFDPQTLQRVRERLGCKLKLVQLVDDSVRYRDVLTQHGLERVNRYAQGLGPAYSQLVDVTDNGSTRKSSALVANARSAGLLLHPYTFRADRLPPYATTLEELLTVFLEDVGVDGVFCDHPDIAVRVCTALRPATSAK